MFMMMSDTTHCTGILVYWNVSYKSYIFIWCPIFFGAVSYKNLPMQWDDWNYHRQWRRKQFASGGTMPARSAGRNFFDVPGAPSLLCPPHIRGHNDCYRLRDNWSGEVGRGVIKVMGPHILILTAFLVRPLQEGHECIISKMIKYSSSHQSNKVLCPVFIIFHVLAYFAIPCNVLCPL